MEKIKKKKVFVFGIDGAAPELIFDKWINLLPNLKKLIQTGSYAKLNSTIPPLTIVAWNSMFSGKDPSEIGVFGYTYKNKEGESKLANSSLIKTKLVWEILTEQNKKSIVLYVPLSYPVKPLNGIIVSDFMTPSVNSNCAYPESIKEKIKSMKNPELFFDVAVGLAGHKGMDIQDLIKKTYQMTEMQLELAKEFLLKEDWELFVCVMIGTDRLQHMLWRHFDGLHRRFIADSLYKNALLDYYIYLDKKLGEFLSHLDEDTTVIISSDHGMVKQEGKININNWLIEKGYMVLKEGINFHDKQRFSTDLVDMSKTLAYGSGAYNARIFINKEKAAEDDLNYEKLCETLIQQIQAIPDDKGKILDTKVYIAKDIYALPYHPECPDLTIYFDDLRWASNPDFGQKGLYSWETAVGADSAGHARQGIFIINGKDIEKNGIKKGDIGEINIAQVAPTILDLLDIKVPKDIKLSRIGAQINYINNQTINQTITEKSGNETDFNEATLIDSVDGIQFKVYANSHPKGFVIAKPKYIPESLIKLDGQKKRFMFSRCVTRFNFFTKKEIVVQNLDALKMKFPYYFYNCKKHKNWFIGVPVDKIAKRYDSQGGLKQLLMVPESDLDSYLKSVRGMINLILETGITIDDLGISHSTLLGNYTIGKSDIDIIIFGKENGWKVLRHLEKSTHPLLKWKTKEDWAKYYKDRVVSSNFNIDEYVFNMERKKDDGFFDGNVFSIFVTEKREEQWYDWESQHEPLSTVKISGVVTNAYNSIVRPGYYEIKDSEVLEVVTNVDPKKNAITRIVVWARPFNLQAKEGEKIEACGLLEKVKSKKGEYYQIVIGYSDTYTNGRGNLEYLKTLVR